MKKKDSSKMLHWIAGILNLLAVVSLIVGFFLGTDKIEDWDTAKNILTRTPYLQSEQFQEEASQKIYEAIQIAARASRMEKNGAYNPNRIIRIRDYLENKTVYDDSLKNEKTQGICYKLGDLYQWSLKGTTITDGVLTETYKPLYYSSIQDYVKHCNEDYDSLVNQILEALEEIKNDVTKYYEEEKAMAFEAVNVRYVLRNLATGDIITNVSQLQDSSLSQETFDNYFTGFGSYYIFDSRNTKIAQLNIGDYYSYNTHAQLMDAGMHQRGEYQFYVGIDTNFPVQDEMAVHSQEYVKLQQSLIPYVKKMAASAVLFLVTFFYLLVSTKILSRMVNWILRDLNIILRIALYFVGYEFLCALLRLMIKKEATESMVLLLFKLVVLLLLIFEGMQRQRLLEGVQSMAAGEDIQKISTRHLYHWNRQMGEAVNELGAGLRIAVQEQMKSEKMKADLITNVSHDLKTPLTSIINYVDLMKREKIDNPKAKEYLQVLEQKSQRLKQLTEDLLEASRASSGNVDLEISRIDVKELLMQMTGEFEEKFAAKGLSLMIQYAECPVYIEGDGRHLWRIMENLYRNVEKYAMPHSRVYLQLQASGNKAIISVKNISEQPLNISSSELMERFTRGDKSRTTEGSGLGLSIAKDLTELQHGSFDIYLDGDLFKVTLTFPLLAEIVDKDEKEVI